MNTSTAFDAFKWSACCEIPPGCDLDTQLWQLWHYDSLLLGVNGGWLKFWTTEQGPTSEKEETQKISHLNFSPGPIN